MWFQCFNSIQFQYEVLITETQWMGKNPMNQHNIVGRSREGGGQGREYCIFMIGYIEGREKNNRSKMHEISATHTNSVTN